MDVLLEGGSILWERDYTLMIDLSASMQQWTEFQEKNPWIAIQSATLALVTHCEHFDVDGITIYLFSSQFQRYDKITATEVAHIFEDNKLEGKTRLAPALKDATDRYFERRALAQTKPNGETIIIITAGEFEDPSGVRKIIIDAANQLNRDEELAIELIQVGSDPFVSQFFQSLDQELKGAGAKFDICHTVTLDDLEDISLTDVLIQAIVN